MDELVTAEHTAVLSELIEPLRAAGAEVQFVPASDAVELPTLLVRLDAADEQPRWLNLNLLPDDDVLAPLALVQMYSAFPVAVSVGRHDHVARLCTSIGLEVPVGSFGLNDDEIYFRYMLATRQHGRFDAEVMIELIGLIRHVIGLFSPALTAVAAGTLTVDEALAGLAE